MSFNGPPKLPSKEKEPEIEISPVQPEDYRGALEVLYKAQLENYPNEELGITKEDIEANFEGELSEEKIREGEERWRNRSEDPNELYLIAKQDGKVIGRFIADRHVEQFDGRNQLVDIYIDPEAQGKGLGKKFWSAGMEFFDPKKETVVMVLPYNEQAKGYYRSLGFAETGRKANDGEGTRMASGAIMPVPIEMVRPADEPES